MSAGFVYIMFTPAAPDLVKIGRTRRTSELRASELSGTGLPDGYILIFEELVVDCEKVETRLQQRFRDYRYRKNREFFRLPIPDAIRGLCEEASDFRVPRIGPPFGVEILPDMKRKYGSYLRDDIHSIRIVNIEGVVYLETARTAGSCGADEMIERTDLSAIIESDADRMPLFPPTRNEHDNARMFVHRLHPGVIAQRVNLFTAEACAEIHLRLSADGKDLPPEWGA